MTTLSRLRHRGQTAHTDTGNAVVEAAILAPLFILFLAALLVAARIANAAGAVDQSAADAVRQASIARTPGDARNAATASALQTLRDKGLHCAPRVSVDVSGFDRAVGTPATVTAQVSCTIRLADVALPGLPGARTVTTTHRSALDPYRSRGGGP